MIKSILRSLLKKYGAYALSWLLTKLFTYLFKKYGSMPSAMREVNEITDALNHIATSCKDGIVTEEEVQKAIPLIEAAVKFK